MPNRDLVVIGASAGGIEALQEICSRLPADLKAAVLIVIHLSPQSGGYLPKILGRVSPLPAKQAEDNETLEHGKIYTAPPDCHMLVEDGHLRTIKGPRENRHRPAIDPTLRSAANTYRQRVIGVILSGLLDDGTSGLMVVCARGGEAIVQDPKTAMFPSMPTNALHRVPDAKIASLEKIPELITNLVREPLPSAEKQTGPDRKYAEETDKAEYHMPEVESEIKSNKPSQFACPECGGVLWEIDQQGFLRFRCRVGHAYTAMNLRAEQRHAVETALWSALRALEENASLYHRMADRAQTGRQERAYRTYSDQAKTAETNANTLREFLVHIAVPEAALDEVQDAA